MEKTKQKDYLLTVICYVVWGFQPLYYMIKPDTDTMFLLMSRIIWAGIFVTSIVLLQGRGRVIIETFKKKDLMLKHIVPAAVFNFTDWGVYMWAVMNGHVLAASMAYYIAPLAVCYFGVIFYREKMTWQMGAASAIIVAGVLFAGDGFGSSPLVIIILMFCFAAYAAFMKGVKEDSPLCTSVMMILAAPVALLYIAIFHGRKRNGIRRSWNSIFPDWCRNRDGSSDSDLCKLRKASADDDYGIFTVFIADFRHRLQLSDG